MFSPQKISARNLAERRIIRARLKRLRLLAAELLEARHALAVDIQLLSDINPIPQGSAPDNLLEANGVLYFAANGGSSGVELWKSNGTVAGTTLVKDINSGRGNSNPSTLINVGGTLYFVANDGHSGRELWKSDGTAAGTKLVKDINPGSGDAYFSSPENIDGILYFSANGELWKSDGTAAGTILVKDIASGIAPYEFPKTSTPNSLLNVGGVLYFAATDGPHGRELWKSNGTTAGTQLVKDIAPGKSLGQALSSSPSDFFNINGTLYFLASEPFSNIRELWKSDGTAAGTVLVKGFTNGGITPNSAGEITSVGNQLFFSANGGEGAELWRSDGTTAGTMIVKDIYPGFVGEFPYISFNQSLPQNLTNVGGMLFFTANDGLGGRELWKSDGTETGTSRVKDIRTGLNGSDPSLLENIGGSLYFAANDGQSGRELWKSNGTTAGTSRVKDINAGISDSSISALIDFGGKAFFAANDGQHGTELWKSNGTAAGTTLVAALNSVTSGSSVANFVIVDDASFFAADDGNSGRELWKSDGTAAGTFQIKDINPGPGDALDAAYADPVNIGGLVYFVANDGQSGSELWRSDGTANGTTRVKDIRTGMASALPGDLTNVGNVLYFTADDGQSGRELWKSDGTAVGTIRVKDIHVGDSLGFFGNLTNLGGVLYFSADDGQSGFELWKSDGTEAGTIRVKDINVAKYGLDNTLGSQPSNFFNFGGTLYFAAADTQSGKYTIWKSDGTESGTVLVKATNFIFRPDAFTNVDGELYFAGKNQQSNPVLWRSNGTTAGTVAIKTISNSSGYAQLYGLTNVGGQLYFSLNDGLVSPTAAELWKSDGTPAGTVLVKDINPGNGGSLPDNFTNAGGVLYFTADDGQSGRELWKSDGTAAGTVLVQDISSGSFSSLPQNLLYRDGTLFFSADDGLHGREPWKLELPYTALIASMNAAGNVQILSKTDRNDKLTISRSGANLLISDASPTPSARISINGLAEASGNGTKTVSIPLATIQATGKPLVINTGSEDDIVNLDTNNLFSNGPIPATGLTIALGAGEDRFDLVKNPTANVWNITGAQSGSVAVGSLGAVVFSGLEHPQGGNGKDVFKLSNAAVANGILSLDGDTGSNLDSVEVARDANYTLTNTQLTILTQAAGQFDQTYSLANIKTAILTGGNSDNFLDASLFTGPVVLNGSEGNDVLWGGSGNDKLTGGNGHDWLSGNAGDDILIAWNGRDVLVGGDGIDQLNDKNLAVSDYGDDILIGGRTSYDTNKAAIDSIMVAWLGTETFLNRIQKIKTTGVGSGSYKLNASTVFDDGVTDTYFGGIGSDWYFARLTQATGKESTDATGVEVGQIVNL